MATPNFAAIRVGDQVFTAEGADPVGAVRDSAEALTQW
jgi:hypothetical protein